MTDTLQPNQSLTQGASLISSDGSYRLVFQGDGNVVIYNSANKATWDTQTSNTQTDTSTLLIMQGDGNFVLYGERVVDSPPFKPQQPPHLVQIVRYQSATNQAGAYLVMQNDGNLVMYKAEIVAVAASHLGPKFLGGHSLV